MTALRPIAGGPCADETEDKCGNGDCPTVYATADPEMLAVQGSDVPQRTPEGESIVLIPESLLKEAARVRGWF